MDNKHNLLVHNFTIILLLCEQIQSYREKNKNTIIIDFSNVSDSLYSNIYLWS